MTFKAIIKDIPVWELKKFKGKHLTCDILFTEEMKWHIGETFEFEPILDFVGEGYVEVPDWFRTSVNNKKTQLDYRYFHESWLERSQE